MCQSLQREIAIPGLKMRTWLTGNGERGLPLFTVNDPNPGPSAQLLEVTRPGELGDVAAELRDFVASRVTHRMLAAESFPWHLAAVLSIPELSNRELPHSPLGHG